VLIQSTAGQVAGHPPAALELVNYGAGHAWLRPELDAAIRDAEQVDQDLTRRLGWPEPEANDEPRYTLTDRSRRVLAMERLFGPWPTVAQADTAEASAA